MHWHSTKTSNKYTTDPVWFNPPDKNEYIENQYIKFFFVLYKQSFVYVSHFFNENREFIQLNDFDVNMPFTTILRPIRVLCLFNR